MKTLLIVLLLFFVSIPVTAQEPFSVRYSLPVIDTTVGADGKEQKCLNTEQWKIVIFMASDYKGLYDWRLSTLGLLNAHQQLILTYEQALTNKDAQIALLIKDREYMTLRLKQSYDLAEKQSTALKIERITMWSVIVIQSAVILVGGVKGLAQ